MVQELINLRTCIEEQRYDEALMIVDELEGMSRKSILRTIKSFLIRLMIHLIKNQIEQRLTNSWIASISDSIIQIQDLNLQDNKKSHYLKIEEWDNLLEEAFAASLRPASVEVLNGTLKPHQLIQQIDKTQILEISKQLILLTYNSSSRDLPDIIDNNLAQLPGAENWFSD
ncbi:DUF29 family protein [Planktothrix sp. FACHB-1365]|uniref:DUF29 family protein n=1 Tax=Planktothrix sp. FACHB-1365 TaxID=2692855 RepID=UPI0016882A70|nr:DUF29 family protein [Planktothrix sp. FACHB-1365]MBD2483557.1 DUF29 family protein [Planktothrix sp. FACHB-1365]